MLMNSRKNHLIARLLLGLAIIMTGIAISPATSYAKSNYSITKKEVTHYKIIGPGKIRTMTVNGQKRYYIKYRWVYRYDIYKSYSGRKLISKRETKHLCLGTTNTGPYPSWIEARIHNRKIVHKKTVNLKL